MTAPKPPTDPVARYVREMASENNPGALTGTQVKAPAPAPRVRTLQARPRCAVCNKPVEEFTEEEDEAFVQLVFVARCHGEVERVRLDEEVLKAGKGIDFGLAFVPKNALPVAAAAKLLGPAR